MPTVADDEYTVHLPERQAGLDQDEEYCVVETGGETRRIRIHDYDQIFTVPGLYERIYADALSCESPRIVVDLLHQVLREEREAPEDHRVLDFAAGNGLVGAELARIQSGAIVGVDLLPEAMMAAERDRPGVYDDYHAVDITDLSADESDALGGHDFTCLTCVAALGFGDVPPAAFASALGFVADGGLVAFNIRERFVEDADVSGFSRTLANAFASGTIVEQARLSYTHRLSATGEALPYLAMVGRKHGELELAA
jgi:SAM-dependent methyltransferase